MLTPMDIHDHQFKKSFRGYNENEVDDFLDRIVSDYEKILRENDRLKNSLSAVEREMDQYRKLEKSINDTLLMAQRTADEVISAAKRNGDEMKENTARECQTIREQARFEAKQQIDSAIAKRDAILSEYDKTIREKKSFLFKMRTTIEAELAIINQTLDSVPGAEELLTPPEETPAPEETPPESEIPAEVEEVSDGTKTYPPVKTNLSKEVAQ